MDFRILGPLDVRDGDRPVSIGGTRQRALLALLLLHANEVVSSDRLVDELWGEAGIGEGSKALQVAVSRLRKAIGPDALVTRKPGYQLRVEAGRLDLHRFEELVAEGRTAEDPAAAAEALNRALDLWRGPPLDDLSFEPSLQTELARLEELRLAALEDRIEADLSLGRLREAIGELERLTALHPLRERLRGQLMLALYRSGRQAEALEVYRDTRRTLVEELGIEPGRALKDLERAILAQDAELEPAQRAEPVARSEGLVGRERELAELLPLVQGALSGSGAMVLIAGEPGIGKSRLAEALGQQARASGGRVLVGRCWEAGGARRTGPGRRRFVPGSANASPTPSGPGWDGCSRARDDPARADGAATRP